MWEVLLPRSMLAARTEDCRVEKGSGVVTHTISMVVQTAGMPEVKGASPPRGRNVASEGEESVLVVCWYPTACRGTLHEDEDRTR